MPPRPHIHLKTLTDLPHQCPRCRARPQTRWYQYRVTHETLGHGLACGDCGYLLWVPEGLPPGLHSYKYYPELGRFSERGPRATLNDDLFAETAHADVS